MNPLRLLARSLRSLRRFIRFRVWAWYLDFELHRRGGRLVLDVEAVPQLDGFPVVKASALGEGDGTLTLRMGRDVVLGRQLELEVWARGTNVLELGREAHILDFTRLKLRSGAIRIGWHSHVREFSVLKSKGELTIGEWVEMSYLTTIHCEERIELADWVGITDRVTIVDSEHTLDGSDEHFFHRPVRVEPVLIDRNTFVATGAVISAGSRIGRNAAVGAGAVLTGGDYPSGWLIAGMPAKPLKALAEIASDGEPPSAIPPDRVRQRSGPGQD